MTDFEVLDYKAHSYKHKGRSLAWIAANDPDHLRWLAAWNPSWWMYARACELAFTFAGYS